MTLYTIGHSTRTIEAFIALLREKGISLLADIRTVPGSRYNPQYGQKALAQSLSDAGIEYIHLKKLGGLRPRAEPSMNTAWRNASFRNYADYMQTAPFEEGLQALLHLAAGKTTVLLCAEAVPWRCHRSLVSDALLARGVQVLHIMGERKVEPHAMTPFARVEGTRVTYPGDGAADKETKG